MQQVIRIRRQIGANSSGMFISDEEESSADVRSPASINARVVATSSDAKINWSMSSCDEPKKLANLHTAKSSISRAGIRMRRSFAFYEAMRKRRTVREFSSDPVPYELIENAIKVAASAPSGANQQPWKFVVVSNAEIKRKIREAAEVEEQEFYSGRAPDEWLEALVVLGTDWEKPFLETAPYLIVVFRVDYGLSMDSEGQEVKTKHYYVVESVGIACGILLTALHVSGLATLTHTPSPMGFLAKILGRPRNEKPFLLIPVGYPAESVKVPRIGKKPLSDVLQVLA